MSNSDLMVDVGIFPLVLVDARKNARTEKIDIYLPNVAQCERFYCMVRDYISVIWRIKFIATIEIFPQGKLANWACLRIHYNEAHSDKVKEAVKTVAAIRSVAR